EARGKLGHLLPLVRGEVRVHRDEGDRRGRRDARAPRHRAASSPAPATARGRQGRGRGRGRPYPSHLISRKAENVVKSPSERVWATKDLNGFGFGSSAGGISEPARPA